MNEVFIKYEPFIEGAFVGAVVVAVIAVFAAFVYKVIRFIIDKD